MLKGIHTALVTPFGPDMALDKSALKKSVRHQLEAGAAGLCALGGTGEPVSMTLDEHRDVIDTVVAEAAGRVPVTVGCLLGGQTEIIAIARHAETAGADHVMITPPYFYSARFFDIKNHLLTVADGCDLPIVFFHSPGRSGMRLTADELLELFHAVPSITGIKEASGDVILAGELLRGAPEGFHFLQGLDELLLPTLAMGGLGGIVSLGELLPRTLGSLYRNTVEGNLGEASRIQLEILPLCRWIYLEPNPGPLKFALQLAGRSAGPSRRPIYGPRDATRKALQELVPPLLERER